MVITSTPEIDRIRSEAAAKMAGVAAKLARRRNAQNCLFGNKRVQKKEQILCENR